MSSDSAPRAVPEQGSASGAPSSAQERPGDGASSVPGESLLVLVTADWCAPARPAVTMLSELSRRWGTARPTAHVANPDGTLLDALGVDVLPTWVLLERLPRAGDVDTAPDTAAGTDTDTDTDTDTMVRSVADGTTAMGPDGTPLSIAGRWCERARLTGALPKHVVAETFGPR